MEDDRVTIAKILKPVGMRGEMKVAPLTDVPGRFEGLETKPVFLSTKTGETRTCTVGRVRRHSGFVYVSFLEIRSLEEASRYANGMVQVDRSEVPSLPEGSYYHFDLIGLSVTLENERRLGKVEEILQTGGNDVLVVRDGGSEYLIPAIRSIVIKVDLIERRIIVRPMEGMLE